VPGVRNSKIKAPRRLPVIKHEEDYYVWLAAASLELRDHVTGPKLIAELDFGE
jgi:hypothetical protein